jgi:cation:H+ antiporter
VLAGAEPEELLTAAIASARHHPGIAAGDAIGANITMLTVVLGLAALIRPVAFGRRVRNYAIAAAGTGILAAAVLHTGVISRPMGASLVLVYAVVVALVWWKEREPPTFGEAAELKKDETSSPSDVPRRETLALVLLIAGIAAMVLGGWLAVGGAERIVTALKLRESVVGLTFVALATTAELFALVWAAARRGLEELALAGVLGSAIYNATATLGTAALIHPISGSGLVWQSWLAAALPVALVVWTLPNGRLGRIGGAVLVATYGAYLAFTFGR